MTIQNTQVASEQPSVETLVGDKKQEYPKPSIPPEEADYTEVQTEDKQSVENDKNTIQSVPSINELTN